MNEQKIGDAAGGQPAGPNPNGTAKSGTMPSADKVERTVVMPTSQLPPVPPGGKAKGGQLSSRNLSARFSLEVFRKKNRTPGDAAGKTSEGEEFFGRNLTRFTNTPIDNSPEVPEENMPDLDRRYEDLEVFNEGGQGVISAAKEPALGRIVALKTLKTPEKDPAGAERDFITEAKVTAQLDHPSIIPIYAIGRNSREQLQLAMKLINGKTLREHLKNITLNYRMRGVSAFDERASLFKRLEIFLHVCDAMVYAHHRGIMHCDLKPENIMIGEYCEVYLMDWGLAKPIPKRDDKSEWVRPETIAGTPRYLSPEAVVGDRFDERADIFAMGLILQEITTLKYAVPGEENNTIMSRIRDHQWDPPEQHRYGLHVDADLAAIIRKATAYRKEDRYQSVRKFAADVRFYMQGNEVSARPDNLFRKMARQAYRHRTLMLIIVLAMLTAALGTVAFTVYRNLEQTRLTSERNEMINRAFGKCFAAAAMLDRTVLSQEKEIAMLANLIAQRLSSRSVFHHENLFSLYGEDGTLAVPDDAVFAPAYQTKVSFSRGMCKALPGVDPKTVGSIMRQLSPVLGIMHSAILASGGDLMVYGETREEKKERAVKQGLPVKSFYVGLAQGIQLGYPWRDIYGGSFDPRKRPWYLRGIGSASPVWGKPYVGSDYQVGLSLPCSMQISDEQGKVYGVVGMDLNFNTLSRILRSSGNTGGFVRESVLIDSKGIVLASSASSRNRKYQQSESKDNSEVNLKPFEQPSIRHRILSRKFGFFFIDDPVNGETLYLFAQMKSIDWFYVEKIDFDVYRRYFRQQHLMQSSAGFSK